MQLSVGSSGWVVLLILTLQTWLVGTSVPGSGDEAESLIPPSMDMLAPMPSVATPSTLPSIQIEVLSSMELELLPTAIDELTPFTTEASVEIGPLLTATDELAPFTTEALEPSMEIEPLPTGTDELAPFTTDTLEPSTEIILLPTVTATITEGMEIVPFSTAVLEPSVGINFLTVTTGLAPEDSMGLLFPFSTDTVEPTSAITTPEDSMGLITETLEQSMVIEMIFDTTASIPQLTPSVPILGPDSSQPAPIQQTLLSDIRIESDLATPIATPAVSRDFTSSEVEFFPGDSFSTLTALESVITTHLLTEALSEIIIATSLLTDDVLASSIPVFSPSPTRNPGFLQPMLTSEMNELPLTTFFPTPSPSPPLPSESSEPSVSSFDLPFSPFNSFFTPSLALSSETEQLSSTFIMIDSASPSEAQTSQPLLVDSNTPSLPLTTLLDITTSILEAATTTEEAVLDTRDVFMMSSLSSILQSEFDVSPTPPSALVSSGGFQPFTLVSSDVVEESDLIVPTLTTQGLVESTPLPLQTPDLDDTPLPTLSPSVASFVSLVLPVSAVTQSLPFAESTVDEGLFTPPVHATFTTAESALTTPTMTTEPTLSTFSLVLDITATPFASLLQPFESLVSSILPSPSLEGSSLASTTPTVEELVSDSVSPVEQVPATLETSIPGGSIEGLVPIETSIVDPTRTPEVPISATAVEPTFTPLLPDSIPASSMSVTVSEPIPLPSLSLQPEGTAATSPSLNLSMLSSLAGDVTPVRMLTTTTTVDTLELSASVTRTSVTEEFETPTVSAQFSASFPASQPSISAPPPTLSPSPPLEATLLVPSPLVPSLSPPYETPPSTFSLSPEAPSLTPTPSPSDLQFANTTAALPLTTITTPSGDLSPSQTTTFSPITTATTDATTTASTATSALTSSPVPSPLPMTCPSLFTPNLVLESSDHVTIGLALTKSEQAELATPNSAKRCSLESALVDVFVLGVRVRQGGVVKRQALDSNYDADITFVGELSMASSNIRFYVLEAAINTTSDPIPVPATDVALAISAANVDSIDTYPVIFPAVPETAVTTPTPTSAVPTSDSTLLLIAIFAGVGGAIILLLVVVIVVVCYLVYSSKKGSFEVQNIEGGRTYSESRDFQSYHQQQQHTGIQHGTPMLVRGKERDRAVSISHMVNGWMDGEAHDRPASRDLQVPVGLLERVAHYATPSPPTRSRHAQSHTQPSPPIKGLRMRLRNTVAPSPSSTISTKSSEGVGTATPAALKGVKVSARAAEVERRKEEADRMREEALRLQEEQEEKELKLRRKATLERLLMQSRERESRSRGGQRSRRKKRGTVAPAEEGEEELPRPPSQHGKQNWSLGGQEGDVETSSPLATPLSQLPAATSSPRPATKRRHRKKGNRVGPTTDGYDSTDHHARKPPPASRQSRHRTGRSQRGRPFTQQSLVEGGGLGGRASRGVAYDTQRELAWLDTGAGGVQLMSFQPIPRPTYSLPPHPPPLQGGGVIQVQPRPQKKAGPASIVEEKLPTLQTGPQSHSYTQKQLETYLKIHQEMERLHLHQSTPAPPTKAQATPTHTVEEGKEEAKPAEGTGDDGKSVPPTGASFDHPPDTPLYPLDSSYASTIQELMQQLNASGGVAGREAGKEDPPEQPLFTPARGTWQPVASPYQLYGPPPASHYTSPDLRPAYTPLPGRQLLWAPTEPHPMAPPTDHAQMNAQMMSPGRLSQLRRNHDYGAAAVGEYSGTLPPDHTLSPEAHPWAQQGYPHAAYGLPSHATIRTRQDPFQ